MFLECDRNRVVGQLWTLNSSNLVLFVDNSKYVSVCCVLEGRSSPGVNSLLVVHEVRHDLEGEGHRVEPGHSINHGFFIILRTDQRTGIKQSNVNFAKKLRLGSSSLEFTQKETVNWLFSWPFKRLLAWLNFTATRSLTLDMLTTSRTNAAASAGSNWQESS